MSLKQPGNAANAPPDDSLPVVDMAALCNAPAEQLFGVPGSGALGESGTREVRLAQLARGLHEVWYEEARIQGRQWLSRPRRDLGILISALTRRSALRYAMTADAMIVTQLRLSEEAIHGAELEGATAYAAITYLPRGSHLVVELPRTGPWYTIAVFGKLAAIDRQWGLGAPIAAALGHSPATLRRCAQVIRKPWPITHEATELLRDALSFRFSGAAARAYVEARAQQLLCEALAGLSHSGQRRLLPRRTQELVQRARALLVSDPAKPHTLQSLARTLGSNRTLLAEGFHAQFGETIFSFLQKERLRRAWVLLEHPGERVASVAAQVGYKDAASFTRAFKAHYGIAPRDVSRRSVIDKQL